MSCVNPCLAALGAERYEAIVPAREPPPPARYTALLLFLAALCGILVAFALVHLRLEVPHEWHGWIVLAVAGPVVYAALDRLAARRRRQPPPAHRTPEPPAIDRAPPVRATSRGGDAKRTGTGR